MIDINQLEAVTVDQVQQVKDYLAQLGVTFSVEDCETGTLFRLPVCPFKGRECGDQTYIIVQTSGNIIAGCHGSKCAGKGWREMQEAFGLPLGEKPKKKSDPVAQLVALAQTDTLFHSPEGRGYVATIRRGYPEVLPIRGQEYRNILRLRFEPSIPKREHVNNAIEQLDARAIEQGEERPVAVRVAEHEGAIYVDLADAERHIAKVTVEGVTVIESTAAPVYFRRTATMEALPMPKQADPKKVSKVFRRFVNVNDTDWPLYLAFLVHCFHPRGPYPIAAFVGGPGHAKSTQATTTQRFVDPSLVVGSAAARNNEDLLIGAKERRLLVFDNLNSINQEMSDNLCRLATGAAQSRRTLFSDSDETVFRAKNPVLITAVSDVITQADLLDRALRFLLPKLNRVRDEDVLRGRLDRIAPYVFGMILDGVASAMRNLPATSITDPPRMIGFALWATAAEEGLGLPKGQVMDAYRTNIGTVREMILETDLAQKIIQLTNTDGFAGFKDRTRKLAEAIGWETSAKALKDLVGQLRLLAPALESVGITVDPDRSLGGNKIILIERHR
jgi:hypothetical protein